MIIMNVSSGEYVPRTFLVAYFLTDLIGGENARRQTAINKNPNGLLKGSM